MVTSMQNTHNSDSVRDIKALCQPLFDSLNINYFDYCRLNNDNTFACLASDGDWLEHFFKRKYKLGCTIKSTGMHLWQAYCDDELVKDAKTYFNHDHGISIFIKKDTYIEYFDFAAPSDNKQILSTYFNNQDILKNFCEEFKEQATPLISNIVSNPITIPNTMCGELVSDLVADNTLLKSNRENLSERQLQCLLLIVKGMTVKQVGRELNLSPRTIEHYIEAIKNKLACFSRAELIAKALQIQVIRDLL